MIHMLCADISGADQQLYDRLYALATRERKEKADGYLRQDDRLRCVTADALLQVALGTDTYRIEKGASGKPYVKDRADFFYNISHSGRYVVIAWGNTEVGVDVQQEGNAKASALARRYFSADEQAYVQADPQRFYEVWTKKESYVKYTGQGLGRDLTSFSTLSPEEGIHYFHRMLDGGYHLSLCTKDPEYRFETVDAAGLPNFWNIDRRI